ncbi:hypothetical protein LCGC14_1728970 [marine sediment metagenome]|uniref:Uncharacterized protein n=1 Tax=marine sediment metagenome TaxID=412755 RepID=A0A0F9K9V4_9ZZZZ
MDLTQLFVAFAVVESAIQSVDLFKERKAIVAGILGAAILYVSDINILTALGLAEDGVALEVVGVAVGFLLAMRGTQVLHELIKKLGV